MWLDRTRIRPARNQHEVGQQPVRDESLHPVDNEVVAVGFGSCAQAGHVGTGLRLGHRNGCDDLAGYEAGEPTLLLLGCRQIPKVAGHDVVLYAEAHPDGAGQPRLLVDDCIESEIVHVRAAVLGRHLPAEQTQPTRLPPRIAIYVAALFPFGSVRHAHPLEERPRRGSERDVFGGEDVALHGAPFMLMAYTATWIAGYCRLAADVK